MELNLEFRIQYSVFYSSYKILYSRFTFMTTDTKELLKRSDIRTMKKDLKRLKEVGFAKQDTILHPALQGIILHPVKQSEKIPTTSRTREEIGVIETKIIEQNPKLAVEQPPLEVREISSPIEKNKPLTGQAKISTPENKPTQKIEPISPVKVFKENLGGQVVTQNIEIRPVQINTPTRQPDLPVAADMSSVKPMIVRQTSNSPSDGQKITGDKIVDIKTTSKDISIKPIVKEKKHWSLASIFFGQKKAEVKKESQPQSNLKPLTSIEPKPILSTSKLNIEAKIVIPSTNDIIKPQQVSTIVKENPAPQQQSKVIEMSNVAMTSPHEENKYLEKIPLVTIEKLQTTIKTEEKQRGKFMREDYIEEYEEGGGLLEDDKDEYLEKIPLVAREKIQTTVKIEENSRPQSGTGSRINLAKPNLSGQRKKFMEDVENWANSNKNE